MEQKPPEPEFIDRIVQDLAELPQGRAGGILTFVVKHPDVSALILRHAAKLRAVFGVSVILAEIAKRVSDSLGEMSEKQEEVGRPPQRLDSPTPNGKFQARVDTGETAEYSRLLHYVIGCSTFDQECRVNRFFRKLNFAERGTTMILESLTPDEIDGCPVCVKLLDDQFEEIPYQEIIEQAKHEGQKVVISLAGIQANQYPRAMHIAAKIRAEAVRQGVDEKIDIMFGGPHIRGDRRYHEEVTSHGFTVVNGEVEDGRLGNILADAVHDRLKPTYELGIVPELAGNPMPALTQEAFNSQYAAPMQFGRGCPMGCNFCAVTNFDGKRVRPRTTEEAKVYAEHLAKNGFRYLFIADDGFYRNPNKMGILDAFAEVSKKTGRRFYIFIQCEVNIFKGKDEHGDPKLDEEFVKKCQEAGVHTILFGVESSDQEVLAGMGKLSNAKRGGDYVEKLKRIRSLLAKYGIGMELTCIVGNEEDTEGIGRRNAEFALEVQASSFIVFILGLATGSNIYRALMDDDTRAYVEPDLRKWDAKTPTVRWKRPGALTPEQILHERSEAYSENYYYNFDNLIRFYTNPRTFSHAIWFLLSTKLGYHGYDNGIGKRRWTEKFDEQIHRANLELCRGL